MSGNQWTDPDCIWLADRTFGERGEQLRLERGKYNGRPTYTLRIFWRTDDGSWRWSQSKPTSSGKHWAQLNLKQRELEDLGRLLLAESKVPQPALDMSQTVLGGRGPMARDQKPSGERFAEGSSADDSIPF